MDCSLPGSSAHGIFQARVLEWVAIAFSSGFLVDSIYMGLVICIHSASLCLLVGAFNPFTFKVIIDIYVPIDIFLIV